MCTPNYPMYCTQSTVHNMYTMCSTHGPNFNPLALFSNLFDSNAHTIDTQSKFVLVAPVGPALKRPFKLERHLAPKAGRVRSLFDAHKKSKTAEHLNRERV